MLLSQTALAIWNDVEPGAGEAFDDWHVNEHVPERLSVPGFLRGRRYSGNGDRYFTLYETADAEVLTSAAYLDRLNTPTPWTTEVVPLVTSRRRTVLMMHASVGRGIGGALYTLELGPSPGRTDELRGWVREVALARAVNRRGVVAAHAGEADIERSRLDTTEERLMERPDDVARWVILLEAIEPLPALKAAEEITSELTGHGGLPDHSGEAFTLTYMLTARRTEDLQL